MAAYLIARVHVTNPEAYEGYKKLAAEASTPFCSHQARTRSCSASVGDTTVCSAPAAAKTIVE